MACRCVLKMDHHCPWINACVGHHNHPPFVKFLFFLTIGCIHAIVINVCFLYYLFNYVSFWSYQLTYCLLFLLLLLLLLLIHHLLLLLLLLLLFRSFHSAFSLSSVSAHQHCVAVGIYIGYCILVWRWFGSINIAGGTGTSLH